MANPQSSDVTANRASNTDSEAEEDSLKKTSSEEEEMMLTTPPQSSDFTAKLASDTDSEAEEDSLEKTSSEEEDEEDEDEEDEDEEEDEEEEEEEEEEDLESKRARGYVLIDHLWVPEYKETEPQWDVDSEEDLVYESDPNDSNYFSDKDEYEEYRVRKRKIFQSKGFLPDPQKGIRYMGGLDLPYNETKTNRDVLTELALLCIDKLNEEKGKTVKLHSIVRATFNGGAIWKIRLTIMVRESKDGPLVEYQAKVLRYAANYKPPFPIFCRPSPVPYLEL